MADEFGDAAGERARNGPDDGEYQRNEQKERGARLLQGARFQVHAVCAVAHENDVPTVRRTALSQVVPFAFGLQFVHDVFVGVGTGEKIGEIFPYRSEGVRVESAPRFVKNAESVVAFGEFSLDGAAESFELQGRGGDSDYLAPSVADRRGEVDDGTIRGAFGLKDV